MKVKIGSFDEELSREVVGRLREVGLSPEVRRSIDVDVRVEYFLKGRLSELKERFGDLKEVRDWERYVNVAREILEGGF